MAQLANSVSKIESQGKLPPQTENNPKHDVFSVTLRSTNSYEGPKIPNEEEEIVVETENSGKKDAKKFDEVKPLHLSAGVNPPLLLTTGLLT
ncbi:hypothetical protein QVD17_12180 [Tagetes erecta]|uniref:Uncharacterized protein n=1 Tax=Tagetes erecta TaxID=13708 RepID=A0AAD8KVF5_TARER|nr:hypothetical protein QVD17_12180 [Tagetes erecta]